MSVPAQSPVPAHGPEGAPQGAPGGGPVGTGSTPPTGRAPGTGMKKAGKILLIIGILVLLLSIIAGVIIAVVGFKNVGGSGTEFTGETTVELTGGEDQFIYKAAGDPEPADCTVTGADGTDVSAVNSRTDTITMDGTKWVSFALVTPDTTQSYDINCGADQDFRIGPPLDGGAIAAGVGGVVLGILGGGLGLVIAIVGLILLLVGRSRVKAATTPAS